MASTRQQETPGAWPLAAIGPALATASPDIHARDPRHAHAHRLPSGALIDRGRLDQIVGEFLQKNPRGEPPALADYLIAQNILTPFQAERLLQGKTQGFVLGPFTLMDALGAVVEQMMRRPKAKFAAKPCKVQQSLGSLLPLALVRF